MKILSVFGTRPEAIKMAPVLRLLGRRDQITSVVCVTAQHREMLDQVLGLFDIKPSFDLDLMRQNQSLSQITADALVHLAPVIASESPDWVLVQGDTTTAMVATLAAFYHRIRIAHIEAGLRTWDKYEPFPEEINRRIMDSICDLHFAPTQVSRQNLLGEGVRDETIRVVGNTVIDALQWTSALPPTPAVNEMLAGWDPEQRMILVTAHRRESFGAPFEEMCQAFRTIAENYPDQLHLVFPVHLNPNAQEPALRILSGVPNISLIPPRGYLEFVHLLKHAWLVLTDSGGIQEEASAIGKPVLILRETTERTEAIDAGTARLVGTDRQGITTGVSRLLEDSAEYDRMARTSTIYGDGHAAERIVETLLAW